MKRSAPVVLLACVSLASAPLFSEPSAWAQGQPTKPAKAPKRKPIRDELPEQARKHWEAARELFDAKDFSGALIEYQRAYDISKNPRVLYNVGVCEKSLKHYARAAARWEQQLKESPGITPDEEQEIKDAIGAVQPFVSAIELIVNEQGATLSIDGEDAGQTPFAQPVSIDVGRHTLKLRKEGFQDLVRDVNVASGKVEKLSLKIEPAVRKSVVSVKVEGAASAVVVIDGTDMGPAPFTGEVTAGRHTFEARAPGFVAARQTSDVAYKEPLNLTLSLAPERHEGKIRVSVDQQDAIIQVDGKTVGSGTWEGLLPSGGHQLVVKKTGYQTYSSDLAVADDQVRTVNVPLVSEQKGAAWIWWSVGALAVIGGGAAASYFIFTPAEAHQVPGSLPAPLDLIPTSHRVPLH
jgi:hypothetical protein